MWENEDQIMVSVYRYFKGAGSAPLAEKMVRNMRSGFVLGTHEKYGFTEMYSMCLAKKEKDCITQIEPEVEPTQLIDIGNPFKKSRKWVGLRRSRDCDERSKCEGFDFRGRYQVETTQTGEAFLRINGLVTWEGEKRDRDLGFGIIIAMKTNDGGSEWAAYSWDPNNKNWLFYSSSNACQLGDLKSCAQKLNGFKYDKTWKSASGLKEGNNYITIGLERSFQHQSQDRYLSLNEVREMKVSFVSGEWK